MYIFYYFMTNVTLIWIWSWATHLKSVGMGKTTGSDTIGYKKNLNTAAIIHDSYTEWFCRKILCAYAKNNKLSILESQFVSCYASVQPLQLFGRGPRGGNYLSLLTNRCPRCAPRPRLACHAPKMTLRQICRMLKVMKQIRNREAAAAASPTRWLTSLVCDQ